MNTPSIKSLAAVFRDPGKAKRILQNSMRPMSTLGTFPDVHGVEYTQSTEGEYMSYLNVGETYTPTLIKWRGRFRVQSLGDFVETMERNSVYFP